MFFNNGKLKADIKVQFKEDHIYAMIRRKNFTDIDILSFVGGLLGKKAINSLFIMIEFGFRVVPGIFGTVSLRDHLSLLNSVCMQCIEEEGKHQS